MVSSTKQDLVQKIFKINNLQGFTNATSKLAGRAFAPTNIALVKYWGKSNTELNIPFTDSLSISLGDLGADTSISILSESILDDIVMLNNHQVDKNSDFYSRIKKYLDIFVIDNTNRPRFKIETNINIPVAAGLASSACGFAAIILALNDLYNWQLDKKYLSIFARLGSGSAARSLWQGFVYWQRGQDLNGLDSYGYKLEQQWSDLAVGLVILSEMKKPISSREAMLRTVKTSVLYQSGWEKQVNQDLKLVQMAIQNHDLELLGATAENNALAMHATMLSAKPAICYSNAQTIDIMHTVWQLRKQGVQVYFTQDAGPNLKLLYSRSHHMQLLNVFPNLIEVKSVDY